MLHVNALAGSAPSSRSVASPLNDMTSPAMKKCCLAARGMVATAGFAGPNTMTVRERRLTPSERRAAPCTVRPCIGVRRVGGRELCYRRQRSRDR